MERSGGRRRDLPAVAALMFANFAISINQGNIAASYLQISQDFGQGVLGLGLLTSSFFLAYAVFELPGGLLAAKVGPRRVAVTGTALSTTSILASGLSPMFGYLLVFRFLAGLGSSLAFPSILVLIVRSFRSRSGGLGVGLMSVAGAAGGLTVLSTWPLFSEVAGWRLSVLTGGVLDAAALVSVVLLVPVDRPPSDFQVNGSSLRRIVFNRTLAALALANFGLAASSGIVANFMIYYMESDFGAGPGFAGPVVGVGFAIPLLTGVLVGRLYDRVRNVRALFFAAAGAASLSVSLSSLASLAAAMATSLTARPASASGSTIALSAAREVGSSDPAYESATVAWVDSFSLFGNSAAPIYFPLLALDFGYSTAWLVAGLVGLAFTIPFLAARDIRRATADS